MKIRVGIPFMKNIIVIILVALNLFNAMGQTITNTKSANPSNIYYKALSIFIEKSSKKPAGTILVEKNYLFTDSLPKSIGETQFEYLDGFEVNERLKNKGELTVIRIVPLKAEGGVFFINIIPFKVRKQKKNLQYLNSGGDKVVFTFDCDTDTFRFKEIIQGNI